MSSIDLINLRRLLHKNAELSGMEEKTADIILSTIEETNPDRIVKDIGGKGIAVIYSGEKKGSTVLFRCDMDALQIPETLKLEYGSENDEVSHKCGHDGHMTIMLGFAQAISKKPPETGNIVLLFQPAEETGSGARLVLDDPSFIEQVPKPDYVFALHNLPDFPLGNIIIREDAFASASIGLIVDLTGATSHAAEPHKGNSPALVVAQLIQSLSSAPQFHTALHEVGQVTVIHAQLGEVAFGTSPGYGQVMATLRSHSAEVMKTLKKACERIIINTARAYELDFEIQWREEFPATINDHKAVELIEDSAKELNLQIIRPSNSFPWSEDFGHFTNAYKGAMFGLGAGENQPALHHPNYDFPEELIDIGIKMFEDILCKFRAKI